MAGKTPGTPRKTASSRKTPAKKASAVTPIDQNSPQNGNSAVSGGNTVTSEMGSRANGPDIIELIRVRAYELFEQRGRREGFDQQDWAQAEAEVLAKFQREKSA